MNLLRYTYLLRGATKTYLRGHFTAHLQDYKLFDNHVIQASTEPQPWPLHSEYNNVPQEAKLEDYHQSHKTVAYLVIKNDKILHEKYYLGYTKDSKSNSFSMAKSIVAGLLGKAIMDGKIRDLDQRVSDFFPQYAHGLGQYLSVGDLASMASGMDWIEEYYSPLCVMAEAYMTKNLEKLILDRRIIQEPGQTFRYLSGSTQLLGMVLRKATGKTLSAYLSESFWQPLGAEHDALWQLDRSGGVEKAFGCMASNARDFARFAKLYKNGGKWEGKSLLPKDFVELSIRPRFTQSPQYGYGWWLAKYRGKSVYGMQGHLGQYGIVVPEDDLIVMRLGKLKARKGKVIDDICAYLDGAYGILAKLDASSASNA